MKVFAVLFVLISYTQVFSQNKDIFLCASQDDTLCIDENIIYSTSGGEFVNSTCEALIKKYGKKDAHSLYFNSYKKEFKQITNLKMDDKFYISSGYGVDESRVIGYMINMPIGDYRFNPVLKKTKSIHHDTVDYNKNVFVCSKNSSMGKISYEMNKDKSVEDNILKVRADYKKTIIIKDSVNFETGPQIKIIPGNFTGSGKTEYAVSYREYVSFTEFANAVFIMDETGKIIKEMTAFTPSNFYYMALIGTVDVDNDGINEILTESGYYEGGGYELWKYKSTGFEIIAQGFYEGA